MTGPDVVLHIGLHKAATRFLQREVFANLPKERFLFNPPDLIPALKQALRCPGPDTYAVARSAAADAVHQAGERTLLVSEPTISGDMYSAHDDWLTNRDLVRELFPQARIIYFTRRQSAWLQSAYRQQLAKGAAVPIETFLNYRDGAFQQRPARFVGGARSTNARDLRFLEIYVGYAAAFGAGNVYLFRHEDLSRQAAAVYARLCEALAIPDLPDVSARRRHNRAFSAFAIRLFFPGVHRTPRTMGRIEYSSRLGERLDRTLRRIRTGFIQHVFDRLIYRDWDLLAAHGMREQLDGWYDAENRLIERVAREILASGPGPRPYMIATGDDDA